MSAKAVKHRSRMRTVMTIDNLDIEHGILLGKVDKFCYLDAGMEDETEQ